ncbi:MAG TPA: hypothetical protein VLJ61_04510 [Pyrinomonadaceae bacterium]|nr:hypothetical protein [Pyrinomonadaceae bacterium]
MIARLNLSSDPFRNRALPWTIAVAVSAASVLVLALVLAQYRAVSVEADASESQVQAMRAQRAANDKQAQEISRNISPEQQVSLRAAHELVSRKAFSWSLLFSDLEEFLPKSVRVARINVRDVAQAGDQTRADLDLTVLGQTPSDVTGMIDEMNRVGKFTAVPLTENQKSGKGESGYEWTLRVSYLQRVRRRVEGDESAQIGSVLRTHAAREDSSDAGGRD